MADARLPRCGRGRGRGGRAEEALAALLQGELEDLARPAAARRCGDQYSGPDEAVSQQFLADAHRACYWVAGVRYCFDEAESQAEPSEVFADRLALAVQTCLGPCAEAGASRAWAGSGRRPRVLLTRLATMLLSQAGLALVGAAVLGPQLALSGGERAITYELVRAEGGGWDLQVDFLATGFHEYMEARAEVGAPCPCSPCSSLRRGCSFHIMLVEAAPAGVAAEVNCITDFVAVFDTSGRAVHFEDRPEDEVAATDSWWPLSPSISSWFAAASADLPVSDLSTFVLPEGVEEHSAWEWSSLRLAPVPRGEEIVEAWYGHPRDTKQRVNIADDVRLVAAAAYEAGDKELVFSASDVCSDDPASFVLKRLSVSTRCVKTAF